MADFDDDLADPRSLRDWFAGMALSGTLANPDPNMQVAQMSSDDFADMAYEMADAMVLRREGKRRTFGLFDVEPDREDEVEVSDG
jgi:hypothetical protein